MKAPYVASKHGLVGLTKVVALETAGSGITCNAICPGWVLTPLVEAQLEARAEKEGITVHEAKMSTLEEKMPSKEFVMPNEVYTVLCVVSVWKYFIIWFIVCVIKLCYVQVLFSCQVGAMVVYLCSEEARQVTGSTLTIDGGWTTR
jgi:3-hydroxybutyrate dehydrogenase